MNIDISEQLLSTVGRLAGSVAEGGAIVAIDPGSRVAGWCVLRVRPRLGWVAFSGQGSILDCCEGVAQFIGSNQCAVLSLEEPAFIGIGRQWVLAWAGGELRGRLAKYQGDDRDLICMTPGVWRSVLGFRKDTKGSTEDALAFARERGMDCRNERGTDQVDRSMAIGIAFATYRLCATVLGQAAAISPSQKGEDHRDHIFNGPRTLQTRRRPKGEAKSAS